MKHTKRVAADIACTVCGRDIAECKVPGLHGMVRDRAALATKQSKAK